MSVEIGAPARAGSGLTVNPRANEGREQISASQILDWTLRGYVYSLGLLVDDATNIASVTTLADITASVALKSPSGGGTIVVPLRVRATIIDDPGGITTGDISFTKAAADCLTALTITGTTLTGIINHKSGGNTTQCTLLSNCTVSALTVVDSIVIASFFATDECQVGATYSPCTFDYEFKTPLALFDGAALLLTMYAADTATEFRPTFTWAELPAEIYLP